MPNENESLVLLQAAPQDRLQAWLDEFYGKPVKIAAREVLRHRDLSMVERLTIKDALPSSLIYKQVLPPWEVEQDLHERVLIPSISNSATLFLTGHWGPVTALFLEDLGTESLDTHEVDAEFAASLGKELAKMHRSYSYRIDELMGLKVLRSLLPLDYESFAEDMMQQLGDWALVNSSSAQEVVELARTIAVQLAGETVSLVHGDLYAENILMRNGRLFIIDWSWFCMIGVPVMDLASLISDHFKNGVFKKWREVVLDAYCFEAGRSPEDVVRVLPFAEALYRLLFLFWLVERRRRGIMGTTAGPVDALISKVVEELITRKSQLS